MDKASTAAREHIAGMADLVGAVRLPEGSMRATAGTDVVIDVLVFQRRAEGQEPGGQRWTELAEIELDDAGRRPTTTQTERRRRSDSRRMPPAERGHSPGIAHLVRSTSTSPRTPRWCWARTRSSAASTVPARPTPAARAPGAGPLEDAAGCRPGPAARRHLHAVTGAPTDERRRGRSSRSAPGTAADGATIKEGSYLIGKAGRLMQIVDGAAVPVAIKDGQERGEGIQPKAAKIIRALLPIRDAVREVLRAQAADRPGRERAGPAAHRLLELHPLLRADQPHRRLDVTTDPETGEERETHRRPNLAPFADDPDCWLVASIEDYDLESGLARMGPIFRERVIAPPSAPVITIAADALAVTLNELGRVDPDHLAELLRRAIRRRPSPQLGDAVFRNPTTEAWETADAYLSGAGPHQARRRRSGGRARPAIRSATSRRCARCSPRICGRPTSPRGSARPGFPTDVIEAFVRRGDGHARSGSGTPSEIAVLDASRPRRFVGTAAGTSEWGTPRRHAGQLLHDALNSATPQIFDTVDRGRREQRVLNVEATEAAKEKLARIKDGLHRLDLDRSRPHRPARPHLQRPLQQSRAAAFRRRPSDPAGRQQHHPPLRAPEAGDLAHHRRRQHLHRARRRRRKDLRHRRRDHGAEAARPDQQGDAGRARPLPGPGRRASSCSSTRPPASWSPTRPIS